MYNVYHMIIYIITGSRSLGVWFIAPNISWICMNWWTAGSDEHSPLPLPGYQDILMYVIISLQNQIRWGDPHVPRGEAGRRVHLGPRLLRLRRRHAARSDCQVRSMLFVLDGKATKTFKYYINFNWVFECASLWVILWVSEWICELVILRLSNFVSDFESK